MWKLLVVSLFVGLKAQDQTISFRPSAEWTSGYNPTKVSEMQNLSPEARLCDSLCVKGIWALYTTKNWGVGSENTTLVYPVKGGTASEECQSGLKSILSKIYSVRRLGTNSTDGTAFTEKVNLFTKAYFVGNAAENPEKHDSTSQSTNDIRSLAFISNTTATQTVVTCIRDREDCTCYDKTNSPNGVMISDVTKLAGNPSKKLIDCVKVAAGTCTAGTIPRTQACTTSP